MNQFGNVLPAVAPPYHDPGSQDCSPFGLAGFPSENFGLISPCPVKV